MIPLLTIAFVAFAGLAWYDLRRALILLFALLPSYLVRFMLGPVPTTALEVLILILGLVWLAKHQGYKFSLRSLGSFRIPLFLGLAAACFAASYAPNVYAAIGVLKAYYFEPAIVLVMLVSVMKQRQDWCTLFTSVTASGVVVAFLGLVQYATGLGIPAPWNFEGRITSVFDFPNAVGLFLAPIVTALIVSFLLSLRGGKADEATYPRLLRFARKDGLKIISIVIMSIAIVLAETEATFVAIPAALLITLLVSKVSPKKKLWVTFCTAIIFCLAVAFVPSIQEKILLQDISGQARTHMWRETAELLADHPLLGAGLSGFPAVIEPYHDATLFEIFQYPHNVVLNIWVELGVLGLVVFGYFIFVTGRVTLRNQNDGAVLAVAAALLVMCIHGLVDVPFFKNDLALMTAGFIAFLASTKS